jgi:hypothetical protein
MLTIKGMLVGVNKSEKMMTKTGKKFQMLQVLSQDQGRSTLYEIRDYSLSTAPLNKVIEVNVYASLWVDKAGQARNTWNKSRTE